MAHGRTDQLKVLFVSAEVAPFSREGGLSQVSYFLPQALRRQGVDVRIFTPKYGTVVDQDYDLQMLLEGMEVPTGDDEGKFGPSNLICNVKTTSLDNAAPLFVYFLENREYYELRNNVYGYSDDHIRFALLSRAVLEFIKSGEFVPDIIHCNDWHTGYLINYLHSERETNPKLAKIATLLSIHNMFQGNFNFGRASQMDYDDGKSPLAPFFSKQFQKQNALKRGIMFADRINTVSEKYARELLTEQYGGDMHKLFRELRGKMSGILNGLDYTEFDPASDTIIRENFTPADLSGRAADKKDLQREFDLDQKADVPILGISGRLDSQKGLDLVMETIGFVLKELNVQLVVMGSGESHYVRFFENLEKEFSGRVGTHLMPDFILPRKIFAGADIILMPSYYEPGGIVAIEAMRYGAIPVARTTGGLADIVEDFDPATKTGTGFVFKEFSKESFIVAVVRALEAYKRPESWKGIVKRAMSQDYSWDNVARKYMDLYGRTLDFRLEATSVNPALTYRQRVV
ncbi:MAG TPA: glycogen/starch synthase [Candidatus Saccharimonadia bacterium]|nr:glycogen/starch synthase [Candidatus Saccharimonadia bacterium]